MTDIDPKAIEAALASGQAIVCYTKCWGCICDSHHEPPRWHAWADAEDIAHAKTIGQPDPSTSRCGCWCARDAEP